MKPIYAEACGNTFIIFDRLADPSPLDHPFLESVKSLILNSNRDDALILTRNDVKDNCLYLTMHVLGPDGAFGNFCGNGTRAVAAYLYSTYPEYKGFFLLTPFGLCPLHKLENGLFSAEFPINRATSPFIFEGNSFTYGDALEPHLTLEADLSDVELYDLGKKINRQTNLFPERININAWQRLSSGELFVKTYERGVQRLTKSCGTGSAVCALVFLKGDGHIAIQTPGGKLEITISNETALLAGQASLDHED
jgi:diaminopimelate epimerase